MGKTQAWALDDHSVDGYLKSRPSLVMFDGLDEIFDNQHRERITQDIIGFSQRYPGTRIIVTSRRVGYTPQILRDAGFLHFEMQDLDDEQIDTFVEGWFALIFSEDPYQAQQGVDRVKTSIQQSKHIRLLAGNPMLLTMMASLARQGELPRDRARFYQKAVEVLCHYWDANRNLSLPEDRHLDPEDKLALLRRIAIRMQQSGSGGLRGNIIVGVELEEEIQRFLFEEHLQPDETEAKKAARRMIRQLRERNYILCRRGPHLYGFVHRTFLEYLTAAEYVRWFDRQPQRITFEELLSLFDQHCGDQEWWEVLRLICGQIDDVFVGQIVEHLAMKTDFEQWNGVSQLPEFPLAIYCLGEGHAAPKLNKTGAVLFERIMSLIRVSRTSFTNAPAEGMDILRATEEVGMRWPGRPAVSTLQLMGLSELRSIKGDGLYIWCSFLVSLGVSRDFISSLCTCCCPVVFDIGGDVFTLQKLPEAVKSGAIYALAEKWPDETSRALITNLAVNGVTPRDKTAALTVIVHYWPDSNARALVAESLLDASEEVRGTATMIIGKKWNDQSAIALLVRQLEDPSDWVKAVAVQFLSMHGEKSFK